MAKHTRKRRSYNLRKVRLTVAGGVGAVAPLDVTSFGLTATPINPTRVISVDASYNWADIQQAIDDGLTFGLAHGDYLNAEIEECLEATNSINPGDKIQQERANRLVRYIGVIQKDATGLSGSFNNGKRFKVRLNWPMSIGKLVVVWIRNSSGTVWVTGSTLAVDGNMWVKDGF